MRLNMTQQIRLNMTESLRKNQRNETQLMTYPPAPFSHSISGSSDIACPSDFADVFLSFAGNKSFDTVGPLLVFSFVCNFVSASL